MVLINVSCFSTLARLIGQLDSINIYISLNLKVFILVQHQHPPTLKHTITYTNVLIPNTVLCITGLFYSTVLTNPIVSKLYCFLAFHITIFWITF